MKRELAASQQEAADLREAVAMYSRRPNNTAQQMLLGSGSGVGGAGVTYEGDARGAFPNNR